jgi:S-layer protein (TIGR01567 family)
MKLAFLAIAGFLTLLSMAIAANAADGTEIKSAPTDISIPEFTWNAQNFAGFYYDIDKNLGTERLTLRPAGSDGSTAILDDMPDGDGNPGAVYQTTAQTKYFKFKPWGSYNIIGFLGEPYFAGYRGESTPFMDNSASGTPLLYDKSKSRNLMSNEQISQVLIDEDTEIYIDTEKPLQLEEGYELSIKSVNDNETRAVVELRKNGQIVDTKIVQPSLDYATVADKTYIFKSDMGSTQDIITIAVYFKNVFHGGNNESDSATVSGIFQISNTPMPIAADQEYGKMRIRTVDANDYAITMDNKDNRIMLSRNKDVPLMGDINIRTADQSDTGPDNPLRYYIYKSAEQNI